MTLSIPLSSIDLEQRRDFGDLSGLCSSLQTLGTIHPPVLSQYTAPDGSTRYQPIAGRRRLKALSLNGVKELHHNSTLEPDRPGFCFKTDVPEDILREAELDENLHRLKPKWQEDAVLIYEVHELKRQKHGASKWGQRQTAELLSKGGKGFGKSSVNLALKVAELLLAKDPEICACDSLDDANTIRIKRAEDAALAEMQKRVTPVASAPVLPANIDSFLTSFTIPGLPGESLKPAPESIVAPGLQTAPLVSAPPVQVPLSQMFRLGDFRTAMHEVPFVNHIVTDIPYGIDMENLNKSSKLNDVASEHEVEANVDLMRPFLEFAWNTVKPQGFVVFFYDLDHHEKLQGWAKDIGFKVQRWPLVWAKTHTCQNNAAQYNTTKNFEVAMVLRKDEHTVLRSQVPSSVFSCDGAAERKLYQNPFAKPFDLWKWIYDMVAFPGQTVLDPFCGEMSSCRAALNCGLVPYGIEVNEKHYNRGLENMRKAYAVIHKSNVAFI